MDQRANAVEEDLRNILNTRMALADKIQTLEQRIDDTVRGTKAAAMDAIDLARDKAAAWVESASRQLDPSVQAERRPWVLVGSAVAIGFLAGWVGHQRPKAGVYPYYSSEAKAADVMPSQGAEPLPSGVYPFYSSHQNPSSSNRMSDRPATPEGGERNQPGDSRALDQFDELWDELTGELTRERQRLQGAVLQVGRSFILDLVRIAGQTLLDQLAAPRSGSRMHEAAAPAGRAGPSHEPRAV